jgi:hypothetical protein
MQLEAAHAVEITHLVKYIDRKEDPLNGKLLTKLQNKKQKFTCQSPRLIHVPLIKSIQFKIKCFI